MKVKIRETGFKDFNKNAQSTFEYILVVTAALTVLIGFIMHDSGGLYNQVEDVIDNAVDEMGTVTDDISF